MIYTVRALFILLLLCCVRPIAYSQNYSNKGTDFWVGWMNHVHGATGNRSSQMSLYLTSDVSTSGTVTIADGSYTENFTITANQVTIITVPASAYLALTGNFLKGIHINAQKPIVVYAHIYADAVSGATLVLPVSVLAKEYISINYKQQSNEADASYSAFIVIATEDDTRVEITPVTSLLDGKPANTPFSINLKKGEVYQALSNADLTGSKIHSVSVNGAACKKVAVFSGSGKVYIGCNQTRNAQTSDNLFQQVYPQRAWGKNYITVPLSKRPYDIFRIILSDPATRVTLNGQVLSASVFTNGSYYEFSSTTPNVITADKQIQVVQYAVSQTQGLNCNLVTNDLGDPEMIFLSPVEQSVNRVTLYSSGFYAIQNHYVNILIKKDHASSFTIDGAAPNGSFQPVAGNTDYLYGQFPVTVGTHTLAASEGFNAIAYGFGSRESYGYSAGTNVKDLKQYIQVEDPSNNNAVLSSACANKAFSAVITLAFEPTKLTWYTGTAAAPIVDTQPLAIASFEKEGQTFYQYKYPGNDILLPTGSYAFKVEAFNPVADECGSTEEINLDLNVLTPPITLFDSPDNACLNSPVIFTDKTDPTGQTITEWFWDFGDGHTSTEQNPHYTYTAEGTYTVKMYVKTASGCASPILEKTIKINPSPVADFSLQNSGCVDEQVVITNQSTISSGTIKELVWDFGDGNKQILTDFSQPISHGYSLAGNYTVSLTATAITGCSSTLTKNITIYTKPVADFTVPNVCVADVYAEFGNKSETSDGQTLTYTWNFGDPSSATNISYVKTPQHIYTQPGTYTVTLTAKTDQGCTTGVSKQITVNGSAPVSAFNILNNGVCSGETIMLNSLASVDFGHIIRAELDWGDGTAVETDNNPAIGKQYNHAYAKFSSPSTKTYNIRLKVYSGQTCYNELVKTVTVKAVPELIFTNAAPVCVDATPYMLTVSAAGFTGSGTFSGNGVTAAGLFNPGQAGAGTHSITYHFTPDNGCPVSKTQAITVNPLPVIVVQNELTLLEGGSLVLQPKITGNNLTYNWSPAVGLNRTDIANPTVTLQNETDYTLTVTSTGGCISTAKVHISILKMPLVPNTFTPNGDGINDLWNIRYLNTYISCVVDVFNRYGTKLYHSVGYPSPWDGRANGTDLPPGTYYYIIEPKNGRKTISGSVTIIR